MCKALKEQEKIENENTIAQAMSKDMKCCNSKDYAIVLTQMKNDRKFNFWESSK